MAFGNFNLFNKPKVERAVPGDMFSSIERSVLNQLNDIRRSYQQNGTFTTEQIKIIADATEVLKSAYGKDEVALALEQFMNEEPTSRLDELGALLERNQPMKMSLLKCLADADSLANPEALKKLNEVKSLIKISASENFSDYDVDTLCEQLKDSSEYDDFIAQRVATQVQSQDSIIPKKVEVEPEMQPSVQPAGHFSHEGIKKGPNFKPVNDATGVPKIPDPRLQEVIRDSSST